MIRLQNIIVICTTFLGDACVVPPLETITANRSLIQMLVSCSADCCCWVSHFFNAECDCGPVAHRLSVLNAPSLPRSSFSASQIFEFCQAKWWIWHSFACFHSHFVGRTMWETFQRTFLAAFAMFTRRHKHTGQRIEKNAHSYASTRRRMQKEEKKKEKRKSKSVHRWKHSIQFFWLRCFRGARLETWATRINERFDSHQPRGKRKNLGSQNVSKL